jgi:RND superfamily putative drug exporter
MTLAGDANWWAPRWLRRIHDRIGISEHVELDDGDAVPDGGELVGAGAGRDAG